VALGMLLNVEPEKVAQLLANGGDKIEEYSKKINAEMDRLHKEKGIHDHKHTNDNHDHKDSHQHDPNDGQDHSGHNH
jgi:hypothetical protein